MKHMFFLIFTLVSVLLFLSLSGVRGQEKNPFEGKPDAVTEGEEIFKKRCVVCHGEGGKGDICPDLTDKEWKYGNGDKDLFQTISKGRPGGMPNWDNTLGEEKIWKVISYIRSIGLKQGDKGPGGKKAGCDIQSGPCINTVGEDNLRVLFDVIPRPVTSMSELLFSVTLEKEGGPVQGAEIELKLTMPGMYMGENSPVLSQKGEGRYEGKGILPTCPKGEKTWKGEVKITRNDMTETVSYVFEIE
jgi:cytochrome c5